MKRLLLLIFCSFLIVACNGDDDIETYPEGVENALVGFSRDIGIDRADLRIDGYEEAEWPDGCLGFGQARESCTEAIVPGYGIDVEADGREYELRSDEFGENYRYEED